MSNHPILTAHPNLESVMDDVLSMATVTLLNEKFNPKPVYSNRVIQQNGTLGSLVEVSLTITDKTFVYSSTNKNTAKWHCAEQALGLLDSWSYNHMGICHQLSQQLKIPAAIFTCRAQGLLFLATCSFLGLEFESEGFFSTKKKCQEDAARNAFTSIKQIIADSKRNTPAIDGALWYGDAPMATYTEPNIQSSPPVNINPAATNKRFVFDGNNNLIPKASPVRSTDLLHVKRHMTPETPEPSWQEKLTKLTIANQLPIRYNFRKMDDGQHSVQLIVNGIDFRGVAPLISEVLDFVCREGYNKLVNIPGLKVEDYGGAAAKKFADASCADDANYELGPAHLKKVKAAREEPVNAVLPLCNALKSAEASALPTVQHPSPQPPATPASRLAPSQPLPSPQNSSSELPIAPASRLAPSQPLPSPQNSSPQPPAAPASRLAPSQPLPSPRNSSSQPPIALSYGQNTSHPSPSPQHSSSQLSYSSPESLGPELNTLPPLESYTTLLHMLCLEWKCATPAYTTTSCAPGGFLSRVEIYEVFAAMDAYACGLESGIAGLVKSNVDVKWILVIWFLVKVFIHCGYEDATDQSDDNDDDREQNEHLGRGFG